MITVLGLTADAKREGNYVGDKSADIHVSFCEANGFSIPIEIKKDTHNDIWRAIHEQLVRDLGADRHWIYLAFWFGEKR